MAFLMSCELWDLKWCNHERYQCARTLYLLIPNNNVSNPTSSHPTILMQSPHQPPPDHNTPPYLDTQLPIRNPSQPNLESRSNRHSNQNPNFIKRRRAEPHIFAHRLAWASLCFFISQAGTEQSNVVSELHRYENQPTAKEVFCHCKVENVCTILRLVHRPVNRQCVRKVRWL